MSAINIWPLCGQSQIRGDWALCGHSQKRAIGRSAVTAKQERLGALRPEPNKSDWPLCGQSQIRGDGPLCGQSQIRGDGPLCGHSQTRAIGRSAARANKTIGRSAARANKAIGRSAVRATERRMAALQPEIVKEATARRLFDRNKLFVRQRKWSAYRSTKIIVSCQ